MVPSNSRTPFSRGTYAVHQLRAAAEAAAALLSTIANNINRSKEFACLERAFRHRPLERSGRRRLLCMSVPKHRSHPSSNNHPSDFSFHCSCFTPDRIHLSSVGLIAGRPVLGRTVLTEQRVRQLPLVLAQRRHHGEPQIGLGVVLLVLLFRRGGRCCRFAPARQCQPRRSRAGQPAAPLHLGPELSRRPDAATHKQRHVPVAVELSRGHGGRHLR